jgi:hypothetical protein
MTDSLAMNFWDTILGLFTQLGGETEANFSQIEE